MKKILHKLRVWLIRKLGGVPFIDEKLADDLERVWLIRKLGGVPKEAFSAAVKENAKLWKDVSDRDKFLEVRRRQIKALMKVIREICRRSEISYYDWCCEYCGQEYIECKHNGWCRFFTPVMDCEDGGTNE